MRPRRFRLFLWLLLLTLIVIGLSRLRFDVDVLNLLPAEVPAVQGLKLYQQHFANSRELIITVQSSDPEQAENAAHAIAEQLRQATNLVAHAIWQPPWLEHPGEAAELMAYLWLNQPPQIFDQLTNRLAPDQAAQTLASTREQLAISMSPGDIARLSYDPFGLTQLPASTAGAAPSFGQGQDLFSSPDGTFRIISVQTAGKLKNYRASLEWLNAIQQIIAAARSKNQIAPDVRIGYSGGPAFVSEISSGMEGDLRKSVGSTIIIIVLLFWWAHRRLKPLLWILALLALVLGGTLALGGLLFGTVNVVSIGFAAILLGLGVDYALVLYQEALHAPGMSVGQLRRALGPGIIWSAVTTSGAFLILNLGGLPGLAQLGSLVAIGVMLAAIVMLNWFLPPLLAGIRTRAAAGEPSTAPPIGNRSKVIGWTATVIIAAAALMILFEKPPVLDYSTNSLRPKNSPAYAEMERIKTHLTHQREPEWLLFSGRNASDIIQKLDAAQPVLNGAVANQQISGFNSPVVLLPRPAFQSSNHLTAAQLAAQSSALDEAALQNGFTSNSLAFTENVLASWRQASTSTETFWPTNAVSQWIFDQVTARDSSNLYALALVYPATNANPAVDSVWTAELPRDGVWLAGWSRLGGDLLRVVEHHLWKVLLSMAALLLLSLWLAFKSLREVLLSLAALLFSGLCLGALMSLRGWSWNLLNMLALPLLLGSGVDYSIHMQLALRRHGGRIRETRRTLGRALLLCAGTTVAGFGSNAFSSNSGLASLGLVCATGIGCAFLTSYFLLPVWWTTFHGNATETRGSDPRSSAPDSGSEVPSPSSLYRAGFWRAGLWLVRLLPRGLCVLIARSLAALYGTVARHRREIVIQNLLPALGDDRVAATRKTKALFQQFAVKLVDLWLYEAGQPIENLLGAASGWEHFAQAQATGRGVLLITPHLGNWEFGGPWLTPRGVKLHVITLAEPGEKFTQLRQASRARWNIETLVIGNDPFAFLEIIKRLDAGATVALLMDRPSGPTAVEVELFGRPFSASVAAAELARASGCVLLPVYIPRVDDTYAAHILPPVPYERAALRDRANRQKLTQEIMRAFQPAIHQHLDQWYHFVPIWPK